MRKTSLFIQARTSSSRLPGKVMLQFDNKTMLETVICRASAARLVDEVIVVTSNEPEDDIIQELCQKQCVPFYRGPLEDVLSRFYQAALYFDRPDTIVRITADCPFIDPNVIDAMLREFSRLDIDYMGNSAPPPGTFPDGLDVEIFTFEALCRANKEALLPSEREHVTFYFWKSGCFKTYRFDRLDDVSKLRFTIDYREDYELLEPIHRQLTAKFGVFSLELLLEKIVESNLDLPDGKLRNRGWRDSQKKDEEFLLDNRFNPVEGSHE